MLKNSRSAFGGLSKLLHWLVALLVCVQFYLIWGKNLFTKGSSVRIEYVLLHKSFGVVIFILALLFALWRISNKKPLLSEVQPRWKHLSAKIAHHSLLMLIVVLPVLGYLMTNASGKSVNFFGLFNLPNLISKNENLGNVFYQTHQILGYLLLVLIGLHLLAALHHHFILKDNVLKRMLP
jgi:cytochrome b561